MRAREPTTAWLTVVWATFVVWICSVYPVAQAFALEAVGQANPNRVLILLPIQFESDDAPLIAELEAELLAGLSRAGTVVERASTGCPTDQCRRDLAASSNATIIVSVTLRRDGPDIAIALTAYQGDMIQPFASSDGICEICGSTELVRQAGDIAALLGGRLAAHERSAAVAVQGTPVDAALVLDGEFVGAAPQRLTVTPGEHTLRIAKTGYQTQERTWTAAAGVEEAVDFELHVAPSVDPPPRTRRSRWPWALVGSGAAAAGAGLTLVVVDGRPHMPTCPESSLDPTGECPNVYTTMGAGIALTTVGIAAIVTGVVVLVRQQRVGRQPRDVTRAMLGHPLLPRFGSTFAVERGSIRR